jgi:hypothetical protein
MPELACLTLTSFDDDALLDAIMAAAAGYVLKQIKGSDSWPPYAPSHPGSRCSPRPPPAA